MELLYISVFINVILFFYLIQRYKRKKYYLKDKYTQAFNYFFFDREFNKYLNEKSCFLFIDIDDFKSQNNHLGYETADLLLKQFVDNLIKQLPSNAKVIRYKLGDEFVIILPKTQKDNCFLVMNHLKENVEKETYNLNKETIKLKFTMCNTQYKSNDSQRTIMNRLIKENNQLKTTANK